MVPGQVHREIGPDVDSLVFQVLPVAGAPSFVSRRQPPKSVNHPVPGEIVRTCMSDPSYQPGRTGGSGEKGNLSVGDHPPRGHMAEDFIYALPEGGPSRSS